MRLGPLTDTVTPGIAPPLLSVARPVMVLVAPCANADAADALTIAMIANCKATFLCQLINRSPSWICADYRQPVWGRIGGKLYDGHERPGRLFLSPLSTVHEVATGQIRKPTPAQSRLLEGIEPGD